MQSAPIPDTNGIDKRQQHILFELAIAVEEWNSCVNRLLNWEDENLKGDPTLGMLALDKQAIEKLLLFGRFLSQITGQSGFPDPQTAKLVPATMSRLLAMFTMRHGHWNMKEMVHISLDQVLPGKS